MTGEALIFVLRAIFKKGHDWGSPIHEGKVSAHETRPNLGTVASYSGIPKAPRIPTPTTPSAPIMPTVPTPGRTITRPTTSGTVLSSPTSITASQIRKKLPF